jgi:anaerobic carbon-monoxide dehydrogenase iron sulfur subunit
MVKILAIDPEKCTSCRLCELACAQRNAGGYRPSRARIRVAIQVDEAFYFPMVCFQCDDAPCLRECPSEALVRDPTTHVVRLIADRCNGCAICETTCPYGVIRCVDGQAIKCECCDGEPECVQFCAPGALRYESVEQWPAAQRGAYASRLEELVKEA